MRQKLNILLVTVGLVFTGIAVALACTPCSRQYDLDETLAAADFVIIAEKKRDGPRTDQGYGWGGPDWIEIRVKETLKGRELPRSLKVNSFDGQCTYGFQLQQGRDYILLVKEQRATKKSYRFTSVFRGCGVQSLEMDGDYVIINGGRWTMAEFQDKLNSL